MGRARPTSQVPTGGNAVQGGGRPTTTKAPPIPLSQQTLSALLQFGIIVSGAQRSLHLSGDNFSLFWSDILLLFKALLDLKLTTEPTKSRPVSIFSIVGDIWFWNFYGKFFLALLANNCFLAKEGDAICPPLLLPQLPQLRFRALWVWPIHWYSVLPVANTLIHYTTSGQYTDIEQWTVLYCGKYTDTEYTPIL